MTNLRTENLEEKVPDSITYLGFYRISIYPLLEALYLIQSILDLLEYLRNMSPPRNTIGERGQLPTLVHLLGGMGGSLKMEKRGINSLFSQFKYVSHPQPVSPVWSHRRSIVAVTERSRIEGHHSPVLLSFTLQYSRKDRQFFLSRALAGPHEFTFDYSE